MPKSLAQRFYDLKTKIGGNREKSYYDGSTGMPDETQQRVTMPNKNIRRIIGQLEFTLQLAEDNPAFETPISKSLEILEAAMENDGVLTNSICTKAEEALLPLQAAAKEYEILLISHAHIDMNWMWGLQETVATTLSTFRTILALMKEYPEFTYSQSQASVYKIVEEYDPQMMDEIKARIKEGRWECTTNAWVETDKNMPNTESLLRHISCTKEYMRDTWGVDPATLEVDFSPDTFGHNANIPEINGYGNVKYYYHCRGHEIRHYLYRWRAPSGKEILVYCEPNWYNSAINPELGAHGVELSRLASGFKTSMAVYGVGNHGGGPTRRDVELAIEMQSWPVYPQMKFGTLHEYFKKAEAVRDKLPLWDKEINFIFTGCYTTQSRIKMGNRKAEAALVAAESMHAMANLTTGYSYPRTNLTKAWQNVLFTHFHDIITGSNVQESREHAMALYANTMGIANTMRENAARAIADSIDTSMIETDNDLDSWSEGAGVGYGITNFSGVPNPETGKGKVRIYTIFNPTPHARKEVVELTLWDWIWDLKRLTVTDHAGGEIPFQLRDNHFNNYWAHKYIRVYVDVDVPALGYKTVVISEKEMDKYPVLTNNDFPRADAPHGPTVLENDHIKAMFCHQTGALISLVDKKTGLEQIKPDSGGGRLVCVSSESKHMSAWLIGRHLGHMPVTKTLRMDTDTNGKLRKTLTVQQRIESSNIKTTISLDKDAKALAYSFDVNWEEYSRLSGNGWDANSMSENIPLLIYHLPLANSPATYQTDIPAGHIRRPGRHQDVCGLQYGAAVYDNSRAVAIITDCKYGYRGVDDSLSLTLINTANFPDPYPERGVHKINLWVAVEDSCPKALKTAADNFCYPMNYVSTGSHGGKLPPESSLLKLDAKTTVFSSAGLMPDGSLYVRVYETCGKNDSVTLTLPFEPKNAKLVDLSGNETGSATVSGNKVTFPIAANCIAGVKIM